MKIIFSVLLVGVSLVCQAQVKFSFATDASMIRNFDGKHPFTAFGQSVKSIWHLNDRSAIYAFISYHRDGKYRSELTATAKQPGTTPAELRFNNRSSMRIRQLSIGFTRWLVGNAGTEINFNLYGMAGFGLIVGRVTNQFTLPVDTSQYLVANDIREGSGDFKRLSMDLAAGFEFPIGFEIYLYTEARLHIPTTSYPNNYLLKNEKAPLLGTANLGLRIYFNDDE